MTPEELIEQVEFFGSAWAAYTVAHADGDPDAAAKFAGDARTALATVKAEIDRLTAQPESIRVGATDYTADTIQQLISDVERFRQHSITLNSVGWKLAVALGEVSEDGDRVEGDPIAQAAQLIEYRNELHVELVAAHDLVRRLANALQDISKACCWRGNFFACDNGGCVDRRALVTEAFHVLNQRNSVKPEPAAESSPQAVTQ